MNHERPRPTYYDYKFDCLSSSPPHAHPIVAAAISGSPSSKTSPGDSEVILCSVFFFFRFLSSCKS